MKKDYKKDFKNLYLPKTEPALVDVPQMVFIQVDGRGNPNEPEGDYQKAVETLYALTYTIKMAPKSGVMITDFFDYVVPPLEGLWWMDDDKDFETQNKSKYCWTAMIRQPEFVNADVFAFALVAAAKKKPQLNLSKARLMTFTEGLCVQCMHVGSFDTEPATLERMKAFMKANSLVSDLSDTRRHHEIYLNDPRKIDTAKMKTVLRMPVRRQV